MNQGGELLSREEKRLCEEQLMWALVKIELERA